MSVEKYATGWQHIGIPVRDMDRSVEFYEGLGFRRAYGTEYFGQRVSFMQMQGMTVELYTEKNTAGQAGAVDHIAINVTDIDEVFRTIREGSYTMLDQEVDERPFWDRGVRFFTILGPDREKIEFNQFL